MLFTQTADLRLIPKHLSVRKDVFIMAGPGGGGSGGFGGGSFGGNFGGSNNGGSFGGSFGGHHHHFGRTHHIRGGCTGSIFTVVALILFAAFSLVWFMGEPVTENVQTVDESGILYSESVMQTYANEQYEEIFGSYEGYEDNILLVFLANEAADGYYTIAWVGDNIVYEINELFGEYREYGMYLNQHIGDYYEYSLDTGLAEVISDMADSITWLELDSSFRAAPAFDEGKKSQLINHTDFVLNEELVVSALESFTEKTGIPCAIVVDMAESVFGVYEEDESVSAVVVTPGEVTTEHNSPVTVEPVTEEGDSTASASAKGIAVVLAASGIVALAGAVVYVFIKKKSKDKTEKNDMPWES